MLCLSRRDDYIAAIGAESLDPHVGPPSYAATHGRCREMARSLAPTFYKTDNSRRFDLLTSRSPSLRPSRLCRSFLNRQFLSPKAFGLEMTTSPTFLGVPAD